VVKSKATLVFDTVGTMFLITATVGLVTSLFDFLTLRRHLGATGGRTKWTSEDVARDAYSLWRVRAAWRAAVQSIGRVRRRGSDAMGRLAVRDHRSQ